MSKKNPDAAKMNDEGADVEKGKTRKESVKKEKIKAEKKSSRPLMKVDDPWKTLRFVLMTEKCVRQIELANEITFVTRRSATKKDISDAFETVFESRVQGVRTVIDQKGRKKAYVRLAEAGQAGEIAIKLGII